MVQSQHSIVDFQHIFPTSSDSWKKESNSIISLSIDSEEKLLKLYDKLYNKTDVVLFREPDICNQATSIAILGTSKIRKKLSNLPLALKGKTLDQVITVMKNTEQMKDLSVYKHGELVREYFLDLYTYLKTGELKNVWRLPDWVNTNKDFLLKEIEKFNIFKIFEYQLYHDCGKPYCLEIDDKGRKHFPDHVNKSYKIWKEIKGDDFVGQLIKQDMDIHLLKNVGVKEFSERPHSIILLLTGLTEIHANSTLFGGIESTSFKIKYKHISKRGKAIIKNIKTK